MTRTLTIFFFTLVAITALLLLLVSHSPRVANSQSTPASISLNPAKGNVENQQTRYVFDVVIHEQDKMESLLIRIEELANQIETQKGTPELALVLHGPEIDYFIGRNYTRYMSLVDRAAELDKKGIIDVKVCETKIRSLGLEQETFPDFIDHVPYGPAEVRKLVEQGYVRM